MASAWYLKGKEKFGNGDVDWINDNTIKFILIDSNSYTADLSADEYLDDVPSSSRLSTIVSTGRSNSNGILDADDAVFPNVTDGSNADAILCYKDSGFESSSALLFYIDNAPEFPLTGDGDDIVISWDNGPNKIISL